MADRATSPEECNGLHAALRGRSRAGAVSPAYLNSYRPNEFRRSAAVRIGPIRSAECSSRAIKCPSMRSRDATALPASLEISAIPNSTKAEQIKIAEKICCVIVGATNMADPPTNRSPNATITRNFGILPPLLRAPAREVSLTIGHRQPAGHNTKVAGPDLRGQPGAKFVSHRSTAPRHLGVIEGERLRLAARRREDEEYSMSKALLGLTAIALFLVVVAAFTGAL